VQLNYVQGLYVWSRFTRHRKLSVFPLQRQIGQ
jgi:hypothetical protein